MKPTPTIDSCSAIKQDGVDCFVTILDKEGDLSTIQKAPSTTPITNVSSQHLRILESDEALEVIEAERQRGLLQAALIIKTIQEKVHWAQAIANGQKPEAPQHNTGVFAVVGVYSGHGPHPAYITAISAPPNTDPSDVRDELLTTYPEGLSPIPDESRDIPGARHGRLANYAVAELPPQAVDLIDWEVPRLLQIGDTASIEKVSTHGGYVFIVKNHPTLSDQKCMRGLDLEDGTCTIFPTNPGANNTWDVDANCALQLPLETQVEIVARTNSE
jgi:hypothetical protein